MRMTDNLLMKALAVNHICDETDDINTAIKKLDIFVNSYKDMELILQTTFDAIKRDRAVRSDRINRITNHAQKRQHDQ